MVVLQTATVGQGLACAAGHFNNPGGVALNALAARIAGDVFLSELDWERYGGQFEADGSVDFTSAHVGGFFYVHQARFKGATGAMHGLNASGIDVAGSMLWQGVELENGAALVLGGARVNGFVDVEHHVVAQAARAAGIDFPVHPHMLRHATGFYLANTGQDTRAIQLYLGHKSIQHTVRYTELAADRFKDFWKD